MSSRKAKTSSSRSSSTKRSSTNGRNAAAKKSSKKADTKGSAKPVQADTPSSVRKSRSKAKRGAPATAKKSKSVAGSKRSSTSKLTKYVPCTDGKGLEIEVFPIEPGRVRVLRKGLDLGSHYIYLDAISLQSGSSTLTIQQPNTSQMSEFWNDDGDGVFTVGVSEQILVHPDIMSLNERSQLLRSVGRIGTATLSFRKDGDSPALVEGRDFEVLAPHRIELQAVRLCEADW